MLTPPNLAQLLGVKLIHLAITMAAGWRESHSRRRAANSASISA